MCLPAPYGLKIERNQSFLGPSAPLCHIDKIAVIGIIYCLYRRGPLDIRPPEWLSRENRHE